LGFVHLFRGIKAAFFEDLTLNLRVVFLGNSEAIIKVLLIQDPLCILGKLIAEQGSLLILVTLAHVTCLVHVGGRPTIESPVVLV